MKKKLLSVILAGLLILGLAGCDEFSSLINKVETGASFYSEYTKYSDIFEQSDELVIDTETSIVVNNTDLALNPENINNDIYIMLDRVNNLSYADVLMNDFEQVAVYEDDSDIVYLIEDLVVTPYIPLEGEEFFNPTQDTGDIFNENFDPQTVTGESLVDGVYSFDVNLNQALNLEELSEFLTEITPSGDVPALDDAIAQIEIEFIETELDEGTTYDIDILVTLQNYQIKFEDDTYVDITLTNHSILTVPAVLDFPQIFTSAYQYVAVDNPLLAKRVYTPDEEITYPVTSMENGYIQIKLEAGKYQLKSPTNLENFTFQVFDSDMLEIMVNDDMFEVGIDGLYFIYIKPTDSFQSDIVVTMVMEN